jgi:membrane-bound lytic murein transglycosylase MltF
MAARKVFTMVLAAALSGFAAQAPLAQIHRQPIAMPQLKRPYAGDFDGILKRRTLRVLVPFSKTQFFIDRGREMGIVPDLARALEEDINKRHKFKILRFHVVIVPAPREKLLALLIAGHGDAVAGNLTITPEREALVDFVAPLLADVDEIVVTGPDAPKLEMRDDLAGQQVFVLQSSSYATHLAALNQDFGARGLKPMKIVFVEENLEDEDILDMVHAGLLPFAIVDRHKAQLWTRIFDGLIAHPDIKISSGGRVAWAIRKNSPQLHAELDPFFESHRVGTSFGNQIKRRYYANPDLIKNAYETSAIAQYRNLAETFRKYGAQYEFDYLMLAAQAYQESQFDQSKRSSAGAVGIMQIKPATAEAKPISITGVASDADANIHAGSAYLRYMADQYLNDPSLSPRERMLMAFAAYNAGPGNLDKFRKSAERQGLDPNKWFNNVEQGAAKVVGRQTVQYVSNIYKYYIAYSLLDARTKQHDEEVQKVEKQEEAAKPGGDKSK